MTNPAYGLAQIFEGWDFGKGTGPTQARAAYARSQGMTQDAVVRLAMDHLLRIEERLDDLQALGRDVSAFDGLVVAWQDSLIKAITLDRHAQTTKAVAAVTPDRVRLLKSLGTVIDANTAALMPTSETVAAIEAAIADAEDFVRNADLTEANRHYFLGLLARIRAAVRDGRPGEMKSAVNEYVGATYAAERSTNDAAEAGRFKKARDTVLLPILTGAAGNVLGMTSMSMLSQAIGQ